MRRGKAVLSALATVAGAAVGAAVLLAACSDSGLSRAEVDEAIQEAVAEMPEPQPEISAGEAEAAEAAVGAALEAAVEAALQDRDLGGGRELQAPMSPAEVESAIQTAIEGLPKPQGLTRAEVDEAIRQAIEAMPESQPDPGTVVDDEAPVPSKSDPAAYTQFVVEQAVALYEAEGLDATLAHYNSPASVDEQWYVFIIDENDAIIGHYDPDRLGLDVNGWVSTDINGYNFGPQMLAATEAGRWVPYVYVNPVEGTLGDEGAFELKNTWVVRRDGLLFGSGWYINTEEFVPQLISESAEHFRRGGLEAVLEFYNDPQGISAGLIPTVEYYNSTDTLDGYFSGFIAAPDGQILEHLAPELIGTDIVDLLGPAVRNANADGVWITADDNPTEAGGPQSMRIWVIDVNGTLIGGGWYRT